MKILDFDKFSSLYEAEDQTSPEETLKQETKDIIRRIITSYGTCYASMASLSPDYTGIISDLNLVATSKDIKTLISTLEDLSTKISGQLAQPYKDAGVDQAWLVAAQKVIEAIKSLAEQYEGNTEILSQLYADSKVWFTGYKAEIQKAKQEADKAKAAVSESLLLEKEGGLFSTKKENARSLLQQATALKAEIETSISQNDKKLLPVLNTKKQEVSDLVVRLAEIVVAKRKEIKEEELKEISDRLAKIPTELNAEVQKLTKANKANQETAVIFLQALNLIEKAIEKEQAVTLELQKKAAEEAAKKQTEEAAKKSEEAKAKEDEKNLKLSGRLDPATITAKVVNTEVKAFQQLVLNKFENYKPFEGFELFTKFKRYGADGRFGPTTKNMVVVLKAGYDLDDESPKITQALVDAIYKDPPMNESAKNFIAGFDRYVKYGPLMEGFDPEKAKKAYKPPTKSSGSASSSTGTENKKEETKSGDTAEPSEEGKEKQADEIKNKVYEGLNKLAQLIVDQYGNKSYWEDYKSVDDNEVLAIRDTFGVKIIGVNKLVLDNKDGETSFEWLNKSNWWSTMIGGEIMKLWNEVDSNKNNLTEDDFKFLKKQISLFGGRSLKDINEPKGNMCKYKTLSGYVVTGGSDKKVIEKENQSDLFTQLVLGTGKYTYTYINFVVIKSPDLKEFKKYTVNCDF